MLPFKNGASREALLHDVSRTWNDLNPAEGASAKARPWQASHQGIGGGSSRSQNGATGLASGKRLKVVFRLKDQLTRPVEEAVKLVLSAAIQPIRGE